MAVTVTRLFKTYSGHPIHDGIVVKAQIWYKGVHEDAVLGATTATEGERTFSISESGLYYFYLGVGDDDLAYDPILDEVLEDHAYGSDADDGVFLLKDVALSSGDNQLTWASLVSDLANRTAFGSSMGTGYQAMVMIRTKGTQVDSHYISVYDITDTHLKISVEPNGSYLGEFTVDVVLLRE